MIVFKSKLKLKEKISVKSEEWDRNKIRRRKKKITQIHKKTRCYQLKRKLLMYCRRK